MNIELLTPTKCRKFHTRVQTAAALYHDKGVGPPHDISVTVSSVKLTGQRYFWFAAGPVERSHFLLHTGSVSHVTAYSSFQCGAVTVTRDPKQQSAPVLSL